ncbi:MAG TPA: DEAD/DEAH box helicase [Methylophilaceae bacterium]|nr:DEAD/DEAH box helicase [Methylophilaceae bacterium]
MEVNNEINHSPLNTTSEKNVTGFDSLGLAAPILQAISDTGYITPTPIQAKAIPVVLTGVDLMAGAQTGTGKTAAFTLPILHQLLPAANNSTSPAKHPVRALVLAPTRELAIQVEENVKAYAKNTSMRSAVVFGGVDIKKQTPLLKAGVEILVATPGRLLDHIEQKTVQLGQVKYLVLDEADRMLDMGFMPDLKKILALLPKQRQTLMFSATFSKEIKKLSDDFLKTPVLIEVARSNATSENVSQKAYEADQKQKQNILVSLLKEQKTQQVIIFTKTKLTASRLSRALEREGIKADAIHGDKNQKERIAALDAFKDGLITALVATDVAARGLDISDLPMVINYEIPSAPEDYVHRIGRTGRAGASGIAISLVSDDEEKYFSEIEKLIKKSIPREKIARIDVSNHAQKDASKFNNKQRSYQKISSQKSHDPWFDKPYVPEKARTKQRELESKIAARNSKKRVATLLGGLKK